MMPVDRMRSTVPGIHVFFPGVVKAWMAGSSPAMTEEAAWMRSCYDAAVEGGGGCSVTDSLGWRAKFAVLIPSTNTSVQPEFDRMRPAGVTNHISRIRIPNMALENDDDFVRLVDHIAAGQIEAVDSAMTCEPDRIVLGISVETFWGGYALSRKL
jgi:hypothetical protein